MFTQISKKSLKDSHTSVRKTGGGIVYFPGSVGLLNIQENAR